MGTLGAVAKFGLLAALGTRLVVAGHRGADNGASARMHKHMRRGNETDHHLEKRDYRWGRTSTDVCGQKLTGSDCSCDVPAGSLLST